MCFYSHFDVRDAFFLKPIIGQIKAKIGAKMRFRSASGFATMVFYAYKTSSIDFKTVAQTTIRFKLYALIFTCRYECHFRLNIIDSRIRFKTDRVQNCHIAYQQIAIYFNIRCANRFVDNPNDGLVIAFYQIILARCHGEQRPKREHEHYVDCILLCHHLA